MPRNTSKFRRSRSRWSCFGAMFNALCLITSFDLAGHTSTQIPHPVQSSGATWMAIRWPARSVPVGSFHKNPSGMAVPASKALKRMAAWGQTSAQRPQSMQISGSQIGISSAIDLFSHLAVPVGKVPSTGSADTGSRSPLPAIIVAVIRVTKSGATLGTGSAIALPSATGPTSTRNSAATARSTASSLRVTTACPLLP